MPGMRDGVKKKKVQLQVAVYCSVDTACARLEGVYVIRAHDKERGTMMVQSTTVPPYECCCAVVWAGTANTSCRGLALIPELSALNTLPLLGTLISTGFDTSKLILDK